MKERRRRRLLKWGRVALGVIVLAGAVVWFTDFSRKSVRRTQLQFGTVTTGDIETTVTATGKIVPAFEEHILSPINSRVLEVYKRVGDEVEEGEPLLLLNLDALDNELKGLYDQRKMKEENLRQQRIRTEADLQNKQMTIETKTMSLAQLQQELRNERFLDSLGSGTGENVRKAEMAVRTAELELRQLKRDLEMQRDFRRADLEMKQLEMDVFLRTLAEKEQLRVDARILSPRKAVLTSIVNTIGQGVGQASEVAVVADLSSFKVEGEISDTYIDKVSAGSEVVLKIGRSTMPGHIIEMSPVASNSTLNFVVLPDSAAQADLRPGVRAEVYVKTEVLENVPRVPNGPFFTSGKGNYELYVLNADSTEVERRTVTLGASNYDYVQVLSGLAPGERVVISDMAPYRRNEKLKVKN